MFKTILIIIGLWIYAFGISQAQLPVAKIKNIGQRTIDFFDDTRGRKLTTEIWYPTNDDIKQSDKTFSPFKRKFTVRDATFPKAKRPLILFSHGSGGNRLSLEWLAQALVTQGYIVAAVDHWGNTHDNKIGIEFIKPWERPLDISAVLTELLDDNTYGGMIDSDNIGVLGFSFGGYTAIALAGAVLDYPTLLNYYETVDGKRDLAEIREFPNLSENLKDSSFIKMTKNISSLKDKRIRSFFALSPGTAQGFKDKDQFKEVTDPVFIIGCQSDQVTPVAKYARHYHTLIEQSEYFEFDGDVGHYVMLAEASDEVKREAPEVFVDNPSVNRNHVHQKVAELAVDFFNKHVK